MKLAARAKRSQSVNMGPHHLAKAASAADTSSETISRNETARIIPNESRRDRTSEKKPPVLGSLGARQIRFSESWSSLNTEVAPIRNTTIPIPAAMERRTGPSALVIRPSTARAPWSPISPPSCE